MEFDTCLLLPILIAEGWGPWTIASMLSNVISPLPRLCTLLAFSLSSVQHQLSLLLGFLLSVHPYRMWVQRFFALMTWPKYCIFCFLVVATNSLSLLFPPGPTHLFFGQSPWEMIFVLKFHINAETQGWTLNL